MMIREILVPAEESAWLPWAVQYFFYIGAAYAASLLFLLALWWHRTTSHLLRGSLALVMAVSAIVGPLALMADAHTGYFYAYFTPWYWMSHGYLLLPLFSLLTVITAWLYLRHELQYLRTTPSRWLRCCGLLALGNWQISMRWLMGIALLTALFGLSIAAYTGSEVIVFKNRALWYQWSLPLLWFCSAFAGAGGLTLLLLCLIPRGQQALHPGDRGLLQLPIEAGLITTLILLGLWVTRYVQQLLVEFSFWFWHLLPLLLLLIGSVIALWQLSRHSKGLFLTALCLILSSAYLRWVLLIDIQRMPHYDAGIYLYQISFGWEGWFGMIGMAGLWLLLAVIGSRGLSVGRRQKKRKHTPPGPEGM